MSCFVYQDRINVWRIEREQPFYTNAVRDLTNSEAGGSAISLLFDHIAFERLDPFFVTLNDLVVNSNIVTGFEFREFFLACHLLVYKGNSCVHNSKFKDGKGKRKN